MIINDSIELKDLESNLADLWALSGKKIKSISQNFDTGNGSPVTTKKGVYQPMSWTDWTQGFEYGSSLLQFDATGDEFFLDLATNMITKEMPAHVVHFGVHDHGFNNHSTYGNLLRLLSEGKTPASDWLVEYCQLALKSSASVQARRWTELKEGGFIYSFNGPHSLFVDTIRTIRILVIGHLLGHSYRGENDIVVNLLSRAYQHALTTAKYSVYYGEGRDVYDQSGRTAHESIFNVNNGSFRCPGTQQGFSPYSTWTRGLSWAMLGFSEQLEFIQDFDGMPDLSDLGGKRHLEDVFLKAATATCDFFIENTAADGLPYWDTGAPGLTYLSDWKNEKSDPFNDWEPVDSSAACIGAQGLLRLGMYLKKEGRSTWKKYFQAGLTVAKNLFEIPYLSSDPMHQGLILHSIYHHPNGWDYIPEGSKIPNGESCMWGDYHGRELGIYLGRILNNEPYHTFYLGIK